MRPKLTYANVMATIAVFIALGGASYAAMSLPKNSVGPKQLKKNAVTTAKIRKQAVTAAKVRKRSLTGAQIKAASLTGAEIDASTLGVVPSAQQATTAQTATSLTPPENWHEVGAPGEPAFEDSWHNLEINPPHPDTVAFVKDHEGFVHLKGAATGGTGPIFRLPPGYRPASETYQAFSVFCEGCNPSRTGVASVYGSGYTPSNEGQVSGEGTFVDLDGITFRAES